MEPEALDEEAAGLRFPVIVLAKEQKVPAYKLASLKKRFPDAKFVNLNWEVDYDDGKSFQNSKIVWSATKSFTKVPDGWESGKIDVTRAVGVWLLGNDRSPTLDIILAGKKQTVARQYSYANIISWFAPRVDMILLMFDAHKVQLPPQPSPQILLPLRLRLRVSASRR